MNPILLGGCLNHRGWSPWVPLLGYSLAPHGRLRSPRCPREGSTHPTCRLALDRAAASSLPGGIVAGAERPAGPADGGEAGPPGGPPQGPPIGELLGGVPRPHGGPAHLARCWLDTQSVVGWHGLGPGFNITSGGSRTPNHRGGPDPPPAKQPVRAQTAPSNPKT